MDGEIEGEVENVVENGAGADNPVNETGFDQGNNGGAAQAGRGQSAGQAHAEGHIGLEHALGVQAAHLAQAGGIVGEKAIVHEVGELFPAGDALGHDAFAGQVFIAVGAFLFQQPIGRFGQILAVTACSLRAHKFQINPFTKFGGEYTGPSRLANPFVGFVCMSGASPFFAEIGEGRRMSKNSDAAVAPSGFHILLDRREI
jgi:hypothetical protein